MGQDAEKTGIRIFSEDDDNVEEAGEVDFDQEDGGQRHRTNKKYDDVHKKTGRRENKEVGACQRKDGAHGIV